MPQDDDASTAEPAFALRDAWLPALPVLPLVLSAVLFAWLIDPQAELDFLRVGPEVFAALPQRAYLHLGDMLSYYSLAAFHSLLCFGVIATFAAWTWRLPARRRQGALTYLAGIVLIVVLVSLFFHEEANSQVLTQLGYKAICQLIAAADLPTHLVSAGQCFQKDDISRLTLLAWIPTFSGMGAVAVAAAYAYASARGLPAARDRNDAAWREALDRRIRSLQRSVYLLSAVLVSSTVTITLFAHLPVGLLPADGKGSLAAAVSHYASGLSTFWGALFSVTLVATFIAPALHLLIAAYGTAPGQAGTADLRSWLSEHVFQSLRRQLATVFSLLAPLLVGPLSSLLSSVAGL